MTFSNCGTAEHLGHPGGEVELARVGDQCGDARFERRRPWSQIAAERPADDGDAVRVHALLFDQPGEGRRERHLEVRPHRNPMFVQHPALARAFEDEEVVTAGQSHVAGRDVAGLGGRVVAAWGSTVGRDPPSPLPETGSPSW